MTLAGRPCQFPFFYRGTAQTSCVPYSAADSAAFCLDTDGRFAMCSPQPLSPYSTFQTWLDQWAGKGALETAVRASSLPSYQGQIPRGCMSAVPREAGMSVLGLCCPAQSFSRPIGWQGRPRTCCEH